MTRGEATRGARAFVAGCLVAALLLVPGNAFGKVRPDWSRVQALPDGKKTQVRLYDDEAPLGARKIRGVFLSATESSLTILLPSGKSRTFERGVVRGVRVRRPVLERYPGWIWLAGSTTFLQILKHKRAEYMPRPLWADLYVACPLTFMLVLSTVKLKEIYNVPPKHRIR